MEGAHGKKVLVLTLVALHLCMWTGLAQTSTALDKEEAASIHKRASACFDDYTATFPDHPQNCDNVCITCHGDLGGRIIGQIENPEGTTTDEAYLGFSTKIKGSDDSWEEKWTSLDEIQQSCRECHTEHCESYGNHPIFAKMDFNNTLDEDKQEGVYELKSFDGMMLCTTCHNPHQEVSALLRITNSASSLCLTCHDK